MGVQVLGQLADAGLQGLGGIGEGEGLEAAGFDVDRIVTDAQMTTGRERPEDMDMAGEDAQGPGVVQRDVDEFVVRQDGLIQEHEGAVFGGLHGGDITSQVRQCRAEILPRLPEYPPVVPIGRAVVLIPFRFHPLQDPLIDLGVPRPDILCAQPEQVDDHDPARALSQIATVEIPSDMPLDSRQPAQA